MEELSTKQAADLLGIEPSGVRMAIKTGKLKTLGRFGERNHIISRDEVERYRRENLGRGRKRKEKGNETV